MITPVTRLTAAVGEEPVYVVGFDATHALCVFSDGHLSYVEHRDVTIKFPYDLEAEVWFQFGGQDADTANRLQDGETATGSVDGVQPTGASGEDADSLPLADGLSDSDVAEPAD